MDGVKMRPDPLSAHTISRIHEEIEHALKGVDPFNACTLLHAVLVHRLMQQGMDQAAVEKFLVGNLPEFKGLK